MQKGAIKRVFQFLTATAGLAIFLTACTEQGGTITIPSVTLSEKNTGTNDATQETTQDPADSAEEVAVRITALERTFRGEFYGQERIMLTQLLQQVDLVSGNERVAKLLEQYKEDVFVKTQEMVASTLDDQACAFYGGYGSGEAAQYDVTYEFRRADKNVLSMYEVTAAFWESPYPTSIVSSLNYDMQTGEQIAFTDVVKDVKKFSQAAFETLKNSEEYAIKYEMGGYHEAFDKETYTYLKRDALAWTITNEGVELWYDDYQAGAYASGHVVMLIPYAEHQDLMDGKYFENAEEYDVTTRVSVDKTKQETLNAFDYCFQEFGFFPFDLSLISGLYRGADGSTLKIYDYGTFVYENGETYVPGDIRAIEGGFLLITGFYNEEKNEYEYENSGDLAYAGDGFEGGLDQYGSQVYSLEEKFEREGDVSSNPWTGKEITAKGCDIVLFEGVINERPFDEADMSVDEYNRSFWLYSSNDVKNLQLFNVEMVASTEYGLVPKVGELWFSKQQFTTDDLWRVTISIPGDLPCNGFSYENAAGETKYFVIGDSGLDGSLYMEEFTPQK